MKYEFIADRRDRDHVYRASLEAEGKTKQDALTWDAAIPMFAEGNDPKHKRTEAEGATLWTTSCSGERIVSTDIEGHAGKVREKPEYSLAAT